MILIGSIVAQKGELLKKNVSRASVHVSIGKMKTISIKIING